MELIAVIAILGALAMNAMVRFVDLSAEAHRASVEGTAAAFATAVRLVHVRYVLNGLAGPQDNIAGFGDGTLDTNANGYPTDTRNRNAIGSNPRRCLRVWNAILSPAPTIQIGAGGGADYRARAAGQTCRYVYRRDAGASRVILYNSLTGEVTTTNP